MVTNTSPIIHAEILELEAIIILPIIDEAISEIFANIGSPTA